MVSTTSIIAMVISMLLCFGTPVFFFLLLRKRANKLLVPIVAGTSGFFLMQIIIRIPLLSVLKEYTGFYEVNIYLLAILLGSSAAIFETFGRVITVRLFMKDDTRLSAGIAHGIGHGGIEAILLVGITYITNLVFSVMINSGTFISVLGNTEVIIEAQNALINTQSYLFLLGGVERVLSIVFHITLSVLVVYAFRIKRKYPIIIVLLVHTFIDFSVVILGHWGVNAIVIELFIAVVTAGMVYVIYKVYQDYKKLNEISIEKGESNV